MSNSIQVFSSSKLNSDSLNEDYSYQRKQYGYENTPHFEYTEMKKKFIVKQNQTDGTKDSRGFKIFRDCDMLQTDSNNIG